MTAPYLDFLNDHYDALLIANGTPVKRRLFSMLRKRADSLVALDGGVNLLQSYNSVPDLVSGDLDSANPSALQWARENGARVRRLPSQELPDFAKGLQFCRDLGCRSVIATGVAGDRLDHVIAALSFANRVRGIDVVVISDEVAALAFRGRVIKELPIPRGHTLSWFGSPEAEGCSLSGVRWPFRNRTLRAGGFYSLSNRATGEPVGITQRRGRSLFIVSLFPQASAR